MTQEHTPLPWEKRIFVDKRPHEDFHTYKITSQHNRPLGSFLEGDANFILEAVNSHYAMKTALEAAEKALEMVRWDVVTRDEEMFIAGTGGKDETLETIGLTTDTRQSVKNALAQIKALKG